MISLYVGSTSGYSGKSLVTMGLGLKFKKDGLRVGYIKPVGILPIKIENILSDKDAWFIYRALELKDPISELCPVVMTQELSVKAYQKDIKGLMGKIEKSYEQLSGNKDIMIVGGSGSIYSWSILGVSGLKVIRRLNAKAVIVVKYEGEYCVDYILQAKKDLDDHFIGVIFNKVTHEYKQGVEDYIVPFLKRRGVDIIGILPHDPLVGSITVEELTEMLGGKVLCCHDKLSNLIERFLIGAMQVDRATEYFKRTKNNAVIVGGDRADIQLSAIESGTECLVLTGELYPSEIIIARAEQKDIPIIVVRDDTYAVAKKLEKLSVRLRLRDKAKVSHGMDLVMESVNFPLLYKKLGVNIG
ncbi:MAG TPA: phosphotransacetylase family protein [Thermodesulfovibrionales bacterium]|nr:phosphotransacetylase family protein [Thermodesulfovibrionales bacterium]